jgi:basic membrane protein A
VTQAASGTFPKGNYLGTLANRGTALAPFHNFASKVPQSLQAQLRQVGLGIATGSIKITSPNQPK